MEIEFGHDSRLAAAAPGIKPDHTARLTITRVIHKSGKSLDTVRPRAQMKRARSEGRGTSMADIGEYLKRHTEALVKDVGLEAACDLAGKSKATLGRYYSRDAEYRDRFMPINTVAALEAAARHPHVTSALAEVSGHSLQADATGQDVPRGHVNGDVVALSQRFALLVTEYQQAIEDGIITVTEAKRLLRETQALQDVLLEMKQHLETRTG